MKIKKIIAAICAAAAVLSLTGCGNNDNDRLLDSLFTDNSTPASSTSTKPAPTSTSSKRESKPEISAPEISEPTAVSEQTSEPTAVSEPTSEPVATSEPVSEPISIPTIVDQKLVRPEVKDALDAYEAYMNEYCDFMKNYNAAEDQASLMLGYFAILEKYSLAADKLSELDDIELTEAEAAYYLEVTTRVLARMSTIY